MRQAQFLKVTEKGYEYKREMHLACSYRESRYSHKRTTISIIMLWIIILFCLLDSGRMDGNSTTPGPLRKSLHGPPAGTAPSTVTQALTISESAGASHFQKLPGKDSVQKQRSPILSTMCGRREKRTETKCGRRKITLWKEGEANGN